MVDTGLETRISICVSSYVSDNETLISVFELLFVSTIQSTNTNSMKIFLLLAIAMKFSVAAPIVNDHRTTAVLFDVYQKRDAAPGIPPTIPQCTLPYFFINNNRGER